MTRSIQGRLFENDLLYCEGLHKPLLRGKLHAIMLIFQPIWFLFLLQASNSFMGILTSFIYILGGIFSYGMSSILHCFEWDHQTENMILKLDHAAIIVMVGCNYIPIGVLCLTNTGIMMLSLVSLYKVQRQPD